MLRHLQNRYFVVRNNDNVVDLVDVYDMNETAAWLWKQVEGRDFTAADMVGLICENYETDEDTARGDVDKMLETWKEWKLITED